MINSVIQGEDKCIDIQIYDLEQAFDALWLEDCLNDLFDSLPEGERDDKLALIYETNVSNLVAVNTAVGQTDRVDIPRIVQQGGGWDPMECSNSVDTLGKRCFNRGIHFYSYKHMVRVLPLAMVDDILGIGHCGNKSIALNTFINTHIEMKKLKFHTPNTTGKSKCHKLHVGKTNTLCPELRVHGCPMECVQSDTYLGDVIAADGTNTENIKKRISKGNGILAQIRDILETVSFGAHYFKIALLLRESLLINGILTNSEVWYGLEKSEIEELESLDLTFFRTLFAVPQTVPTVSLYLETGSLRIGTIIKVRRVNFLHYLIKLDKTEMLYKFFLAQWNKPVKSDWTMEVRTNLKEFGITDNLENLESMSKNSFENLVKKKAKDFEFQRLLELKLSKAKSKMKNLKYIEFKIQDYLLLKDMNVAQARAMFKFRVRMAPFGENFRGGQKTVICPLCKSHPDGQEESFSCEKINKMIEVKGDYNQIFGWKYPPDLVSTVYNIYTFREEYRKLG